MQVTKNRIFALVLIISIVILAYILILALFVKSPLLTNIPIYLLTLFIIGILAIVVLILKTFNWLTLLISNKFYLFILLISTIIPRLIWVIFVNTKPISDFQLYHEYAVKACNGIYNVFNPTYNVFPFKFGYPLILSMFYKYFGENVLTAKILNIVSSAFLALLIYWAGKSFVSERTGRFASIFFALWPAQIMYSSVLGVEHIFTPLLVLSFGLLVILEKSIQNKKTAYSISIVIGIIIGIANFAKPISIIFFPIFLFYLFVFIKAQDILIKSCITKLKILILAVLSFAVCFMLICYPYSKVTGVPLWKSSSGFSFLIGTNYNTSGAYNANDSLILKEFNFNYEKVHKESMDRAINRITSYPKQFLMLIEKKIIIQWSDDSFGQYWSTNNIEDSSFITMLIKNHTTWFLAVTQLFYLVVLLFCILGVLYSIKNSVYSSIIPLLIFLCLFAIHIFLEVQSRYHYPAMPFLFIMAGYGMEWFEHYICGRLILKNREDINCERL